MPDETVPDETVPGETVLGDVAARVRSKNAGPFWITLDVFFADDAGYRRVAESHAVNAEEVAARYDVPVEGVRIFELPAIRVIKVSFPRPVTQGGFLDNDMHAGQWFLPLAGITVPSRPAAPAPAASGHDPVASRPNPDGLPRTPAEAGGVNLQGVHDFLGDVRAAGRELHGFMLYAGEGVAAEGWWWPYRAGLPHSAHSATKGFTSTAVGIALEEGRFALTDRVVDFFPDHLPDDVGDNLRAMTVADLLTQTSGHETGVSGSRWRGLRTSWVTEFLRIPVTRPPGTHFAYSSATSFMLSAIISATTGDSLDAYLRPRLFEPLGMTETRWDVGPEGINPGGNGLSCTTADLLKLGLLYLRGGRWGGQIVSAEWTRAATRDVHGNGYGYHWWVDPARECYHAFGAFGQYAFVFPEHGAVLALTGGVPWLASGGVDPELENLVWTYFPAVLTRGPSDPAAGGFSGRRLLAPLTPGRSGRAAAVSGRTYRMEENAAGLESVRLDFQDDVCVVTVVDARGTHRVRAGLRDWVEGTTTVSGAALHHGYEPASLRVVAGGRWARDDAFVMDWQFVETPFRDTVTVEFGESGLTLTRSVTVNSGATSLPPVRGTTV